VLTKSLCFFLLTLLLSACSSDTVPKPYILDKSRTSACQEEIEQTISILVHAQNLSISKDVFSQTSSLYLSNKKDAILTKSPIYNDLRGRKSLIMYKENNDIYIGLINKKEDIVKSQKLQECF